MSCQIWSLQLAWRQLPATGLVLGLKAHPELCCPAGWAVLVGVVVEQAGR